MNPSTLPPPGATEAAVQIRNYLAEINAAMGRAGAPESERAHVMENLLTQITEMVAERYGNREVMSADIAAIIQELDTPESYAASILEQAASSNNGAPFDELYNEPGTAISANGHSSHLASSALRPFYDGPGATATVLFTLFGIILPTFTLGFEIATRFCSEAFFNPIPTWGHAACVALVPAFHLCGLVALRRKKLQRTAAWMTAAGIATGICVIYTIPFLPLTPFAFIAIAWAGAGLLPLTPLIALLCGLWLKRQLRLYVEANELKPARARYPWGILAGILLVTLCYLPSYLIFSNIHDAAHGNAEERARAMSRLRMLGGEDDTLRLAYAARNRTGDLAMGPWSMIWTADDSVPREDARLVYYRLTGKPFNSVPPPATTRGLLAGASSTFERNPEMRDGTVGWIDKDLTLASSRIDAIADAATATGYVEWMMTFKNATQVQREARSQILLPPGGVVSRLTLWVNGEEREAAFAGRAAVKEAYENIVAQRKDPVLVTSSGPDRILVQCFPVPPGGEMKIRIGVTHQLPMKTTTEQVHLPRFLERNFDVPAEVKHALWLEADGKLEGAAGPLKPGPGSAATTRLAGQLTNTQLEQEASVQLAGFSGGSQRFADLRDPEHFVIQQDVTEVKPAVPGTLFLVVDTSSCAAPFVEALANACRDLPANLKVRIILASDDRNAAGAQNDLTPRDAVDEILRLKCAGGQDNIPALYDAWRAAASLPDSAIVWAHGPQAVQLQNPDSLVQVLERGGKSRPVLHEVLLAAGPDRIVGEIERYVNIQFVPGVGKSAIAELHELFKSWRDGTPDQVIVRTRHELAAGEVATSVTRAGGHIARLWAFAEAMRLLRDKDKLSDAVALAVKYQLVTPFTGAVVLETQQQYAQAGLQPVQPGTVPTIPEPEEWALIIVASLLLAFGIWKYRGRLTPRVAA